MAIIHQLGTWPDALRPCLRPKLASQPRLSPSWPDEDFGEEGLLYYWAIILGLDIEDIYPVVNIEVTPK